ncbi:MAG: CAP domain-containing protein [Solirubrobacteraceae bacterium]
MTAAMVLLVPGTATALTANQRAERKMTRAINAVRAEHGLPAFRRSASLTGSAERYSDYLMQHDVFGHQSSIWASGRFALLGEALEMHTGPHFRVGHAVQAWLASPPHREILLSPVMRRQGAGVTRGRFGRSRAVVWVLHVGRLTLPGTQLPNIQLP